MVALSSSRGFLLHIKNLTCLIVQMKSVCVVCVVWQASIYFIIRKVHIRRSSKFSSNTLLSEFGYAKFEFSWGFVVEQNIYKLLNLKIEFSSVTFSNRTCILKTDSGPIQYLYSYLIDEIVVRTSLCFSKTLFLALAREFYIHQKFVAEIPYFWNL